jgi:putative ABC transport system permease protein
VVSDRFWRTHFGGRPDVIGQSVTFNGRAYEIIGVLPRDYEPLISERFYSRADVWAPLGYAVDDGSACRTCRHLRAIGRLRPGLTLAGATVELAAVQRGLRDEFPADYGDAPATMESLHESVAGAFRRPLQVLTGAVAFLLLMACANVAGLLIARAADRQREIAVRTALGAGRARVMRQLLTESLLLAAAATAIGLVTADATLVWLASDAPAGLPRLDQASAAPTVWLMAAAAGTLSLVLFGLLPAFETARPDLQAVMRATRQSPGRRTTRIREGMVVAQVAIALMLLIGSGLLYRTVDRLLDVNPGFSPDGVLTAGLSLVGARWAEDEPVYAFQEDLLARVRGLPGVEAAGLTSLLPLGGSYDRRGLRVEGQTYPTPDEIPRVERYGVSPGYFDAMRIPLQRGRLLTSQDTPDSEPVLVINETAARTIWPDQHPVGARVRLSSEAPPATVVGIVADVRHYDLTSAPIPQMYLPESQSTDSFLYLVVRAPSAPAGLADQIRQEVAALASDVPVYEVRRLEDVLTAAIGIRRFMLQVLGLFAIASLALAAVGLYGVIAQSVRTREREMSIRASLGAGRSDLVRLVLRRTGWLMAIGLGAGAGLGALAAHLLESQLFETTATDPVAYLAAAGSLLTIGLVAHIAPLRRAALTDPTLALRGD